MKKSFVNSGIEINLFRDVSRGYLRKNLTMEQEGWKALTRIGVLTRTGEEAWIKKVSLGSKKGKCTIPCKLKKMVVDDSEVESLEESSITIRPSSPL